MERVIVKLGGSIITRKSSLKPVLDRKNLLRVAGEIAAVKQKTSLVVVHGAGSFGHPLVKENDLTEGFRSKKQFFHLARVQSLMNELNVRVCNFLLEKGVPAYPFQHSAGFLSRDRKITEINVDLLGRMLDFELVPVLFGTPSIDSVQGFSIISGDQIMSYLASRLKVKKVVFATNVDGIYDLNPHQNENAKLLRALNGAQLSSLSARGSLHTDVTGGMKGKIGQVLKMRGVKCHVVNGMKPGNVKAALSGDESFGTLVSL